MNQLISSELYYKQTAVEESIKRSTAEKAELNTLLMSKRNELEMLKKKYSELTLSTMNKAQPQEATNHFNFRNLELNLTLCGITKDHFISYLRDLWKTCDPDKMMKKLKHDETFKFARAALKEVKQVVKHYKHDWQTIVAALSDKVQANYVNLMTNISGLRSLKEILEKVSFDDAIGLNGIEEVEQYLTHNDFSRSQVIVLTVILFEILEDTAKFVLHGFKSKILKHLNYRIDFLSRSSNDEKLTGANEGRRSQVHEHKESQPMVSEHKSAPEKHDTNIEETLFHDNAQDDMLATYGPTEEQAAITIQKMYKGAKQHASYRKYLLDKERQLATSQQNKYEFDKKVVQHREDLDMMTSKLEQTQNSFSKEKEMNRNQRSFSSNDERSQDQSPDNDVEQEPLFQEKESSDSFDDKDDQGFPFEESHHQPKSSPHNNRYFYETDSQQENLKNTLTMQNDYGEDAHLAAVKIQSCYKGKKVRDQLASNKNCNQNSKVVAEKIHFQTESQKDDDFFYEERQEDLNNDEEEKAAINIQSKYRGFRDRKKFNQMKQEREEEEKAAIKIQSRFKGYKQQKEYKKVQDSHSKKRNEEERAAVTIQSRYKGLKQRNEYQKTKNELKKQKMEEEKAAIKIQSRFKGSKQRKEFEIIKKSQSERTSMAVAKQKAMDEEEQKAAIKIQSLYKGKIERKKFLDSKKKLAETNPANDNRLCQSDGRLQMTEDQAAVKVQSLMKGNLQRKKYQQMKEQKSNKVCEREPGVMRNDDRCDKEPDFLNQEKENVAATKIQSVYKGKKVRDQYKVKASKEAQPEPQMQKECFVEESHLEQQNAATKIQSVYRGNREREEVKRIRAERDVFNSKPSPDNVQDGKSPKNYLIEKFDKIDLEEIKPKISYAPNSPSSHQHQNDYTHNQQNYPTQSRIPSHVMPMSSTLLPPGDNHPRNLNLKANYKGYLSKKKLDKVKSDSEEQEISSNDSNDREKNKSDYKVLNLKTGNIQPIYDSRLENGKANHIMTHRPCKSSRMGDKKKNTYKSIQNLSQNRIQADRRDCSPGSDSGESFSIPDGKTHFYEKTQDFNSPKIDKPRQSKMQHKTQHVVNSPTANKNLKNVSSVQGNIVYNHDLDSMPKPQVATTKPAKDLPLHKEVTESDIKMAVDEEVNKIIEEIEELGLKSSNMKPSQSTPKKQKSFDNKCSPDKQDKIDRQNSYLMLTESRNFIDEISKKSAAKVSKNQKSLYQSQVEQKKNEIQNIKRVSKQEVKSICNKVFNKFRPTDMSQSLHKELTSQNMGQNNFQEIDSLYEQAYNEKTINVSLNPIVNSNEIAQPNHTSIIKDFENRIIKSSKISNSKFDDKQANLNDPPLNMQTDTDYELRTNQSRSSIVSGGGDLFITIKQITPSNSNLEGNMLKLSIENNDYKIQSLSSLNFQKFKFVIERQKFVLFEIVKEGTSTYSKTFPLEGLLFTERSVVVETIDFFIAQQTVFVDVEFEWIANPDPNGNEEEYQPPDFVVDEY